MVEAAPEDLELKRELFARLEAACGADAVLATNTSSLSVTAIAAEAERPERVCGMHFFNPPALMKLVEVVAGEPTGEPALAAAAEVAERMGRDAGPLRRLARLHRQPLQPAVLRSRRCACSARGSPRTEQIDRVVREAAATGWARSS